MSDLKPAFGEPTLILNAAYTAADMFGDPYDYPPEEEVRWDVGFGVSLMFAREADGMVVRVAVGPDFPKSGRELRATTPDQLRQFACQLIALAEHADRQGGAA